MKVYRPFLVTIRHQPSFGVCIGANGSLFWPFATKETDCSLEREFSYVTIPLLPWTYRDLARSARGRTNGVQGLRYVAALGIKA